VLGHDGHLGAYMENVYSSDIVDNMSSVHKTPYCSLKDHMMGHHMDDLTVHHEQVANI